MELKNILARQPGPEAAEQAALYRGGLRAKAKQLKAMAAELNMAQAQARSPIILTEGLIFGEGVGRLGPRPLGFRGGEAA